MIKGVIFDMDGVLVESELVYRDLFYGCLKSQDVEIELSELNFLAGSCSRVESEYFAEKLNTSIEEADRIKAEYFSHHTVDYSKIKKPYVDKLLSYLVSKNMRIGLASSSKMTYINRALEQCRVKDYFNVIVSGEMFSETKPDPEIYNYSVEAMDLKKDELLVVEDSNYGVQAGKAAGLKVAALLNPILNFDVEIADYKVNSLKDIIKIIESRNN